MRKIILLLVGLWAAPVSAETILCANGATGRKNCSTPLLLANIPTMDSSHLPVVPTTKGGFGVDVSATSGLPPGYYARVGASGAISFAAILAADLPSGIDAAKLGGGTFTNTILGYVDPTSSIQTQLDGKQATMTLPLSEANGGFGANIGGLGTGFLRRFGANTYSASAIVVSDIASALAAGGYPITGTILTAATRIDTPTIGAASGTQHALPAGTGDILTADSTATVTGKSINANQLTGSVADARLSANVDLLDTAQTLTARKTFPAAGANAALIPAILGGGTNTNGHVVPNVADDTFTLNAATQTLTNKTISGVSNTLTNVPAANLTGTVAEARGGTGTDLSAIGTGLIARTGANTYVVRTITTLANTGLTSSNGNGALGNPLIQLSNDVAAIEAFTGTGIPVRTALDTWVQRSVVAGTGTTVTNGTGVSGNFAVNATYGSTASTATEGNDTRLPPAPSGAGKIIYDNGSAYVATAACASTSVWHGGAAPGCSQVNLATEVTGINPVTTGGTGRATLTAHGLLLGDGSNQTNVSGAGLDGQFFRSGGAAADGVYADLPTATSSTSSAGATQTDITLDNTYTDMNVSVTLPAPVSPATSATYLVWANVRAGAQVSASPSAVITLKYYNSTDAADVANSERVGPVATTTGIPYTLTVPMMEVVTVTAAKTIKVYGLRSAGPTYTSAFVYSDSAGRSRMGYVKLFSAFPFHLLVLLGGLARGRRSRRSRS